MALRIQHGALRSSVDIFQQVPLLQSAFFFLSKIDRGRSRKRCAKRKFRGNQFVSGASSNVQTPAKEWDYSEDVPPPHPPCSATQKRLSSPAPMWIADKDYSSSFPYSNPDSSFENDSFPHSLSEDDFSDPNDDPCNDDLRQTSTGKCLVEFTCLQVLLSCMSVCKQRLKGDVGIEDERREGLASSVAIKCTSCGASSGWCDLVAKAGRSFEINWKMSWQ